ncbi:hypothetical protein V8V54_01585, partial [Priestia megaterium]|uniref:hypothetical protein n=1 Tax=Priestia megaterium TaxID=1404 RepID=UPI0030097931
WKIYIFCQIASTIFLIVYMRTDHFTYKKRTVVTGDTKGEVILNFILQLTAILIPTGLRS